MKKHSVKIFALLFVLALFAAACSLKAQSLDIPAPTEKSDTQRPNAMIDANGNYRSIPAQAKYADTGKTYTDVTTMKVHNVLKAYPSGKLFYFRTSKQTGKEYRCYLITNL